MKDKLKVQILWSLWIKSFIIIEWTPLKKMIRKFLVFPNIPDGLCKFQWVYLSKLLLLKTKKLDFVRAAVRYISVTMERQSIYFHLKVPQNQCGWLPNSIRISAEKQNSNSIGSLIDSNRFMNILVMMMIVSISVLIIKLKISVSSVSIVPVHARRAGKMCLRIRTSMFFEMQWSSINDILLHSI